MYLSCLELNLEATSGRLACRCSCLELPLTRHLRSPFFPYYNLVMALDKSQYKDREFLAVIGDEVRSVYPLLSRHQLTMRF